VQLNRFVRELHFGKGVVGSLTSLVMNDIGGLGMFILSLTGLLYWGLPKWWKQRAKSVGGGVQGDEGGAPLDHRLVVSRP
jgi:hypothetical protein